MHADDWTIPRVLERRHREDPEVRALVTDDDAITYAALDDASRALAQRLVAAGVGKGDRVGLLLPNGIEWATIALAATRAGAVLVPLSTLLRPPELVQQLRIASVGHLIAAREYRGRTYGEELESIAPGLLARLRSGGRDAALPALRSLRTPEEIPAERVPAALVAALENTVRPADDLVILFTSGSRGVPKGTIHTHGSILRATASGLEARCIGRGERLYIPMPFFWTGGFCGGLLSVLLAGATLLTEATPEPGRTIRFLERERATLFRGWPDQAAKIAAHPSFAAADLRSLRPASLPAVLPPELRAAPGARANLFGMTESGGPYCGARLDRDLPAEQRGSCGRPFEGVEVRIVDPETRAPVAAGTDGEIQLRGPSLMRGICGRPRSEVFDAAGYYSTGDLGRLDRDGTLWFSGRLDDMFKVKGATVYPSEVEAALRSIPGVAQAFVADVEADGTKEVAALVVGRVELAALIEAACARLSSFKVPTRWLVEPSADAVPMLASGKVDKPALQALLLRRGAAGRASGERDRRGPATRLA